MMFSFSRHCWFLTGATASGKTAVGLELARRLSAEVLSLDSMAVYRGMDVGTAKPGAAERAGVAHHLIDLLEPGEEFCVAQYVEAAGRCAEAVLARGNVPLFVGGSPLYLKALLRGLFSGPPADRAFRRRLEQEAERSGADALHARLKKADPVSAAKLHPRDTRRIIRALEVLEKTGRPISEWQQQFDIAVPREACRVFVLLWPRERLYARINHRVDEMFAAGLVEEVRRLAAAGSWGRTARQAVGYREVLDMLAGRQDLDATIECVKTRTRQFAKRQGAWFRSLDECRVIEVQPPLCPEEAAERIVEAGRVFRPEG